MVDRGGQAVPTMPVAASTLSAAFLQLQIESPAIPPPAPSTSAATQSSNNNSRQVSEQHRRNQQQRLLLLRHASKCQHEDGHCPVTPHCADMKHLWKHIAECKDRKCLVPHCVSSRYILSHYRRCEDDSCPVCGPVREAIHHSDRKRKQTQLLEQQFHQQQQLQQWNLVVPATTAQSAAVPQPVAQAHLIAARPGVPSAALEPPMKRQKMFAPANATPSFPQVAQHVTQTQPLQQPSSGAAMLTQPTSLTTTFAHHQPATWPQVAGLASFNGEVIMPNHAGPKPQEDQTLINCSSTVKQIETHIALSYNGLQLQPQMSKVKCMKVLKDLQSHQHGWVFSSPIDPVELGLPDYFEVIKRPMDLGTIRMKLENGCYHSLEDFESDVTLTFDNAMYYNPEGSVVYNMAKEMKDKFTVDYMKLMKQLEREAYKKWQSCVN